ncbi:MAG: hypothetical protein M1457_01020 [bacterium]|nr:hypothetical protein [bacterium]
MFGGKVDDGDIEQVVAENGVGLPVAADENGRRTEDVAPVVIFLQDRTGGFPPGKTRVAPQQSQSVVVRDEDVIDAVLVDIDGA